jgi:hypothetical protein
MNTFYCEMIETIGQMDTTSAKVHIQRMQEQTGLKWRMDFSEYLFCVDETDEDVHNPAELGEGNCWVVTDGKPL